LSPEHYVAQAQAQVQLALENCQTQHLALETALLPAQILHALRIAAQDPTLPELAADQYRRLRPLISGLSHWHLGSTAANAALGAHQAHGPLANIMQWQAHIQEACQLVSFLPLAIRHDLYLPLTNALQQLSPKYSLPAFMCPPATPALRLLRHRERDTKQFCLTKKLIRHLRHGMRQGYQWQLATVVCAELEITKEQCIHSCQQSIFLIWEHLSPIARSKIKALTPFERP